MFGDFVAQKIANSGGPCGNETSFQYMIKNQRSKVVQSFLLLQLYNWVFVDELYLQIEIIQTSIKIMNPTCCVLQLRPRIFPNERNFANHRD